jgi:hypothetical protein
VNGAIDAAGVGNVHIRNRWQAWTAGFALVLAGCGRAEAPKADAPKVAAPEAANGAAPTAAQKPPASTPGVFEPAATDKPAVPASLEEAARVIDLRKFPLPDDGKDLYKSAAVPKGDRGKDLSKSAAALFYCLRRSDGAPVAEFCRTKLGEAGWKLRLSGTSPDFFEFTGFKQGFFLTGSVYDNRAAGELSVAITNHGNIDSRTLPRFAGAELKDNDVGRTIYLTDAKPDAVLEFMRAELKKGGWREVRMPGGQIDMEPGFPVHLRFIQRGIEVGLSVQDKNDKTEVWNSARLLDVELPIMPEARGTVEFLGYSHYVHLFYAMPTGPEKVLEYYRKELPAVGWTMRAGTDKIENGKAKVILEAPEKGALRLELLADKQGTFVLVSPDRPG